MWLEPSERGPGCLEMRAEKKCGFDHRGLWRPREAPDTSRLWGNLGTQMGVGDLCHEYILLGKLAYHRAVAAC